MTTATKINAARALGSVAYAKGLMAVPGCDADLMALLAGESVGRAGIKIMRAWVSGWTQANLAGT